MTISLLPEPSDVVKTTTTTKTTPYIEPPLVSITNPVTYLRRWWTRVISREGIDFRLRIHPVTAFAIIIMVGSASFGAGRISMPAVVTRFVPQWIIQPSPTPDPWKTMAFSGVVQKNGAGSYFLITSASAQALQLQVPTTVDLASLVGKRVLASGQYNSQTGVFIVNDATQMEMLLQVAPVRRRPLASPSPLLSPSPSPSL